MIFFDFQKFRLGIQKNKEIKEVTKGGKKVEGRSRRMRTAGVEKEDPEKSETESERN